MSVHQDLRFASFALDLDYNIWTDLLDLLLNTYCCSQKMFYSKSFALIGGVALAVAPTMYTEAFTATIISTISPSPSRAHSPLCALMMPSDDDGAVSESRRKLGFATAASAFALLFPSSANAVEIVTMDMSMPGAYVRS